jgi:hypothetical protein
MHTCMLAKDRKMHAPCCSAADPTCTVPDACAVQPWHRHLHLNSTACTLYDKPVMHDRDPTAARFTNATAMQLATHCYSQQLE